MKIKKSKALLIAYDYGESGDFFLKCLTEEFARKKNLDLRAISFEKLFESVKPNKINKYFYGFISVLRLLLTLLVKGRRSKLLYKMRNLKYKKIDVGVFIFSSYLRSSNSDGFIKMSPGFMKFYFVAFISLLYKFRALDKIIKKAEYDEIYFYNSEIVYHYGAVRDFLVNRGIKELKFDKCNQKYILSLSKSYSSFAEKVKILCLSDKQVMEGLNHLKSLVYREKTYFYMKDVDISISTEFDYSRISLSKNVAVICMHAVSDDQYVHGPDGFLDLHDWLMSSIQVLRKNGYMVLIKPHPAYFPRNVKQFYIADHRYLVHLMAIFNTYISFDSKNIFSTSVEDVFFLPANLSLIEMKENLGDFLVLTHHGSIAVEAAYLGLEALVSTSSPYSKYDSFVSFYSDRHTLEQQLIKQNSESIRDSLSIMRSLGTYMFSKDLLGEGRSSSYYFRKAVFHDVDGRKANLDMISEWLKKLPATEKKILSKQIRALIKKEMFEV
ncbi:MAG: hypothetical protein AB8V05_07415 [Francisella endosymbiont of Hyalomma scupense]